MGDSDNSKPSSTTGAANLIPEFENNAELNENSSKTRGRGESEAMRAHEGRGEARGTPDEQLTDTKSKDTKKSDNKKTASRESKVLVTSTSVTHKKKASRIPIAVLSSQAKHRVKQETKEIQIQQKPPKSRIPVRIIAKRRHKAAETAQGEGNTCSGKTGTAAASVEDEEAVGLEGIDYNIVNGVVIPKLDLSFLDTPPNSPETENILRQISLTSTGYTSSSFGRSRPNSTRNASYSSEYTFTSNSSLSGTSNSSSSGSSVQSQPAERSSKLGKRLRQAWKSFKKMSRCLCCCRRPNVECC